MHITVWTVVHTVLMATINSYGKEQISTPTLRRIKTRPINKKFLMTDYVLNICPCAKFDQQELLGGRHFENK